VRVLTFCGSWHPVSANRGLLDVVAGRLRAAGVEVVEFDGLEDIAPFDPQLVDDPYDDVRDLRAIIAAADAVIIAAPEYAGALAGSTKNALDWMVGSGSFYEKSVGVACAGTTGGWFARRDLAQTLAWQGAFVVAHIGVGAPRTKSDERGRFTDPATIDAIESFTDGVVRLAGAARTEQISQARAVAVELGIDPHRVAGGADA
jgi:NAD(P)H-dependent FMN reductase